MYNKALKTFQNTTNTLKPWVPIPDQGADSVGDNSTETYGEMKQTLRMTKDMVLEASQILKNAQMEYDSLSSEEGRTTSNNDTTSNNRNLSRDPYVTGTKVQRPSYLA